MEGLYLNLDHVLVEYISNNPYKLLDLVEVVVRRRIHQLAYELKLGFTIVTHYRTHKYSHQQLKNIFETYYKCNSLIKNNVKYTRLY